MPKIIGIQQTAFTGKDGSPVNGTTIFVTEPIPPDRGKGVSADRVFLSSKRLADMDFVPAVGQDITIYYNSRGHIVKVILDDEEIS